MNKFKHSIRYVRFFDSIYIVFGLVDENPSLFEVRVRKSKNKLIFHIRFHDFLGDKWDDDLPTSLSLSDLSWEENLMIDAVEYIINNNLAKCLNIQFKEHRWQCVFEIIDKEILLQLM